MDRYSVPKFLERQMVKPFKEFEMAIRKENNRIDEIYMNLRTKDKDKEFEIRSYWKLMDNIVGFLDVEMKTIPIYCDKESLRVMIPALTHYVHIGEKDSDVLRVLE